jgi:hypothetical protein
MEPTTPITATDTLTATTVPLVELHLSQVMTVSTSLASESVASWSFGADTAPLFWMLAGMVVLFGGVEALAAWLRCTRGGIWRTWRD